MAQGRPRAARSAVLLGSAAVAAFVSGPLLAHLAAMPAMMGFLLFAMGGLLGIAALLPGLAATWGDGRPCGGLVMGAAVAAAFCFVAVPARRFPPINDITTDPVNPPRFETARLLAGNAGRDMSYAGASVAAQQRAAYPDLAPVRINAPPHEVFERIEAVARRMPDWEITRDDADAHVIEGVATSRLFRFKDDFVIEVRAQDGASVVHMRSRSRDGKGDIGANAARIKAFFATLH